MQCLRRGEVHAADEAWLQWAEERMAAPVNFGIPQQVKGTAKLLTLQGCFFPEFGMAQPKNARRLLSTK